MCSFSDINFTVSIQADINILRTKFHAIDWVLCSSKCFLCNGAQTEEAEEMLSSSGMRQMTLLRSELLLECR